RHGGDGARFADVEAVAGGAVGVDLDAELPRVLVEVLLAGLAGAKVEGVLAVGVLGLGVLGVGEDRTGHQHGQAQERNQDAFRHGCLVGWSVVGFSNKGGRSAAAALTPELAMLKP